MKYSELIKFEPINEVIKFSRTNDVEYQKNLVSTFVFSNAYETAFIPTICKILDYNTLEETFGLQVVGNYGTGKSHVMSLVSLIAENGDLINLLNDEKSKKDLIFQS